MDLQRKATIWGLVLAAFVPLMVLLFPTKVGDAFVCAADHMVHLVTAGGSPHLWSHFQWTALCLWVVSFLATVIAGFGLLGVWAQAQAWKRSQQSLLKPRHVPRTRELLRKETSCKHSL